MSILILCHKTFDYEFYTHTPPKSSNHSIVNIWYSALIGHFFSSASINLMLKSFMTARPDLCSLMWLVYFLLLFLTLVCDTYNVINVMLLVCWKLKPLLDAVIETYIWKTFGKLFRITKFMSIANIPNIVMYW